MSGLNAKILIALPLFMLVSISVGANESVANTTAPSALSSPALYIMLALIIVLLLAILAMGESIKAAARMRRNKDKIVKMLLILGGSLAFSQNLSAQETAAMVKGQVSAAAPTDYWGLDATTFYAFCGIILFELLVFYILRNISIQLLRCNEKHVTAPVKAVKTKPRFLEKINASVAIDREEEIMLDHEYDGIKELDNDLPPWWKYGFYASIVFSVFYLLHFHVTGTGKLQVAEYEAEMQKANEDIAEYRKNAANQVSEVNATLLTDAGSLAQGKSVFVTNCAACHGKVGEGGVGPNLTDDYWLHSGSIKDVFISVKYGWPEKGMKAWQQDLSPIQIHQVSSYILSLRGTNPPNAKEPQGDLYREENMPADSLAADTIIQKQ